MARILLDPGHSSTDPGAVVKGIKEADLNLSITIKVETNLMNAGHEVTHYVAPANVPDDPIARLRLAARYKPDVFVSIHANAGPPLASGFEVWTRNLRYSEGLAGAIRAGLSRTTGLRDRGNRVGTLTVLSQTPFRPACLVEVGFLTNKKERGYITSPAGKLAIARGIADGIINYLATRNR